MKEKIPKKEKPPYNLWQNTWWMIGNAWRIRKTVLLLCVLMAAGEVGIRLVELFIAPAILQKVETAAPFSQLLAVILTFSLLLMGLSAFHNYISSNTMFGRIETRLRILTDLNYKLDTTSFPNTEDPEILKKREKAMDALRGNSQAGEAIWETLGTLLKSLAGFVIYLSLLSSLHPLLLLVVMITTVAGYLVNKRCGQWGFRHREEEASYLHKIDYICFHSSDRALGKDIRLFGMLPWIQDLYSGIMKLYKDFLLRREKIRLLGDLADVALSFLRNGIAYFYLISLTLDTGLARLPVPAVLYGGNKLYLLDNGYFIQFFHPAPPKPGSLFHTGNFWNFPSPSAFRVEPP